MRRCGLLLAAVLALGCKNAERECDDYAAKVTELSEPAPGTESIAESAARTACMNGRVSDDEKKCVALATRRPDLLECQGLGK